MTKTLRSILFVVLFASLGLATAVLRENLDVRSARSHFDTGPIYLPRAELLKPFSLGYHNALADILWFRAISYFGEHYRGDRTYTWLAHICDLVTDLDPMAEHVYRFAGLILPWEAGEVDQGIKILEKGTTALPNSWELAYYLGFTRFFFKNDKEQAARDLQRASTLPGAHPGIAQLAATLTRETSGPQATMEFLADLEKNVDSANVRSVIARNMRESAAAAALEKIDAAVAAYRRSTGRTPTSVQELQVTGYLTSIPRDPFGGHFVIGKEGKAASSTGKEPGRTHLSEVRRRALEGKTGSGLLPSE